VTVLHLMTQGRQPYGRLRKCCEKCGLLIQDQAYTDNRDLYYHPPRSGGAETVFVRCEDVPDRSAGD
jgi:hypothetical protein